MRHQSTLAQRAVAQTLAATLALSSFAGVLDAETLAASQAQAAPARAIAPRVAPTAAEGPTSADPGWPRVYTTPGGGRVQIYQPQIASWADQKHLVAYLAVAHHARGADKPVLGTVKVEAETSVALEQRLVSFATLRIAETNFGSLGRDQVREIVAEIERAMPDFERVISLDRVLANLDKSQILPRTSMV